MMIKRSWNDIDDEDSQPPSEGEQTQAITVQKKVVEPTSKLKKACDQMSLKKLQQHQGSDVWLYVPNSFYQKGDDVHAILQNNQHLQKVYRIKSIGWNVLTSKKLGKAFIEDGLQEGNLFIKFIYSNKNEERINTEEVRLQKKVTYRQKTVRQPQEQKIQITKQEVEKAVSKKEDTERVQKKKVKYVQKSISATQSSYSLNISSETINKDQITLSNIDYKSPRRFTQNNFKSPKKYKLKQETSPTQQQKKAQPQKIISQIKKTQIKIEETSVTQVRTVMDQQNKEDSDESLQMLQKKRKKRKNNKNKQSKVEKPDHNNPYSYFMK